MEVTLDKGFLSEYDSFMIWVENFCKDSPAYYIECEEEGEDKKYMTPCILTKVIHRSDFPSEESYSNAVDSIIGNSDGLATGEFVTSDDIYYVEIKGTGERKPVTQLNIAGVNYS